VLQQATSFAQDGDLLASLHDQHGMAGQMHQQLVSVSNTNKKQGVSGESSDSGQTAENIQIMRFEKDFRYASNCLVQSLLWEVGSCSFG
jgi:cGMP-dependent protein kinase